MKSDPGTVDRPIIEIDDELCDGCGLCIPACHEGALKIVDGKARLVSEALCDGIGDCLGHCPKGALKVATRQAEPMIELPAATRAGRVGSPAEFSSRAEAARASQAEPCGCPGAALRMRQPAGSAAAQGLTSPTKGEDIPVLSPAPTPPSPRPGQTPVPTQASGGPDASRESMLSHWPVQIRLVPPTAPFLAGSNLLVAADCVPVAAADFHDRYLAGRTVMLGCPKFDPPEVYVERFARIFAQNPPARVAVAVMEVPCCSGLPRMVVEGMKQSGRYVPLEILVVGTDGMLLERREMGVEALKRAGA